MSQGATTRPHAAAICTGGTALARTAGGPLDAPDLMPAGACNSTEWTDGASSPIATETRTRRA